MCAVKAIPEGFHYSGNRLQRCGPCHRILQGGIPRQGKCVHARARRLDYARGALDRRFPLDAERRISRDDQRAARGCAKLHHLFLYTEDVDTVFNRAVKAGAKVEMPLENQFWGDRYGKIRDPFGHRWGLAQHIEEVAPEEMKKRSEAFTAKMSKAAGK